MKDLYNELIAEGIDKEDAEEIVARVICGESIDSAIQSVLF